MLRFLRYSIKMYFYLLHINNLRRFKGKPYLLLEFYLKQRQKKSRIFQKENSG